jgi:predicted nucleic acid-binding protein
VVDRRRRVVWTGAARAAVEEAASYIAADSPTAGRAFIERIVSAAEVDLVKALIVAADLNIYGYDAYLIACAQQQRCPLVALDRGLIHSARQAGVAVVEVMT